MEDHTTVDSTLAIGEDLRRDFPKTGVVLQSNLRRTAGDLRDLAARATPSAPAGVRVRLVKGAYREPASVAFQHKREVDEAYLVDLGVLFSSTCYPMVATHDPRMISAARSLAAAGRFATDGWETQMLLGIRVDLQETVVDQGQQLRVYVPFGTDWYGYFMRRLAERPANVAFFLRALRHR
jgi:proline dehydrogenase